MSMSEKFWFKIVPPIFGLLDWGLLLVYGLSVSGKAGPFEWGVFAVLFASGLYLMGLPALIGNDER